MPLANLSEGPRTSNAPVPDQEECEGMFEQFLQTNQNDPKSKLTDDEQKKLKTSFADPKFREMLADYMEEISDPKYRAETEE
jgi:dynein assembly factor 2